MFTNEREGVNVARCQVERKQGLVDGGKTKGVISATRRSERYYRAQALSRGRIWLGRDASFGTADGIRAMLQPAPFKQGDDLSIRLSPCSHPYTFENMLRLPRPKPSSSDEVNQNDWPDSVVPCG